MDGFQFEILTFNNSEVSSLNEQIQSGFNNNANVYYSDEIQNKGLGPQVIIIPEYQRAVMITSNEQYRLEPESLKDLCYYFWVMMGSGP